MISDAVIAGTVRWIVRVLCAIIAFLGLWFGMSVLGVRVLGPDSDGLILFGVVGIVAGVRGVLLELGKLRS